MKLDQFFVKQLTGDPVLIDRISNFFAIINALICTFDTRTGHAGWVGSGYRTFTQPVEWRLCKLLSNPVWFAEIANRFSCLQHGTQSKTYELGQIIAGSSFCIQSNQI